MKKTVTILVSTAVLLGVVTVALSHCEIPCGIYDDKARVVLLKEHITTVEKSMKKLSEKESMNQLVRWISNKEDHAEKIQHIVTQYFMTQRVKVPAEGDAKAEAKYLKQLTSLHKLLVTAMKMKQTTDPAHVKRARELVDEFAAAYFGPEDLKRLREHD
ncbi:MAG: superoxide dismutase [Ni] [Planctomycetota bacterium]|jgi:nickel superoxide dismutase